MSVPQRNPRPRASPRRVRGAGPHQCSATSAAYPRLWPRAPPHGLPSESPTSGQSPVRRCRYPSVRSALPHDRACPPVRSGEVDRTRWFHGLCSLQQAPQARHRGHLPSRATSRRGVQRTLNGWRRCNGALDQAVRLHLQEPGANRARQHQRERGDPKGELDGVPRSAIERAARESSSRRP